MTTKLINEAKLAEVNDLGENSAEFVVKPLYYGYGNTLGNSLRRVLLSSIRGAAITAFSIEGTNHEFSAVPGIREDVVDIMLNLKNIRLKVHTDAPVEASLEIREAPSPKKTAKVVLPLPTSASPLTLSSETRISSSATSTTQTSP